jgi:ACGX-repeat protein
MALSNLSGWNNETETTPAASCGTACGSGDKLVETSASCGSACGAGDK